MKRVIYLLLVIALLVLASGAVAQTDDSEPAPLCMVGQGVVSGGAYSLTSLSWQINGSVSGGSYLLAVPAAPSLRGNGCCCTHLPIIVGNAP
ncbi:MAG: hypothetical protein P8Z00_17405 [Anaerolineales bacterium]|jgi:hypothetical protein